jgi:P pilus assembly chaperone PapD
MKTAVEVRTTIMAVLVMVAGLAAPATAVRAELILSKLVIDLGTASKRRDDIEVWNNSDERAYVVVDPSEILNPGKADEIRHAEPDPEKRGLLVSPARMILEPGQRKLVRVAAIGPSQERERVYRVTVKPVAGELSSKESGLKLLFGYDVLVLLRPGESRPNVTADRSGSSLTFRNDGNASLELVDGKQCAPSGKDCVDLPGRRLYAGAAWTQELKSTFPVEYTIISNGDSVRKKF